MGCDRLNVKNCLVFCNYFSTMFYIKYIGNSKKVNSLFNFFYYFYYKYYFNCKKDIFFQKIFSFEGGGVTPPFSHGSVQSRIGSMLVLVKNLFHFFVFFETIKLFIV